MTRQRRKRLDPLDLWLLQHLAEKSGALATPDPVAWKDLREAGFVALGIHFNEGWATVTITRAGQERAAP